MSPDPPDTVQIVITSRLPDVIGDRVRIYQVFQNLIANAISVMDTPQGIIRIEAQDAGASWRFSVADNGPGIEPQHYEHIFKIFHTIDSSVERDSNGIGLALVKKIVELHGGKVWVESIPGGGSTFFFTLPKHEENAES